MYLLRLLFCHFLLEVVETRVIYALLFLPVEVSLLKPLIWLLVSDPLLVKSWRLVTVGWLLVCFFLERRDLAVGLFLSVLVGLTWVVRVEELLPLLEGLVHLVAALPLLARSKLSLLPLLHVVVLVALNQRVEVTA